MIHTYWNDGFLGWGWFLWFGFIFLMLSSFGNWGYTYRAHQRFSGRPDNRAFDILDERYARGDITREEYAQLKSDIAGSSTPIARRGAVASAAPISTLVGRTAL
ncbi:SHOCT domain-containing protein (plasmid) [Lichenicola cladoniae]|uniref:SHOCT domain-containing protein n=2 Tax=Lichenicola cladoniae TaxID=1484109 RepID=A0A6M8HYG9_9PROT|nr:SHOCT domain-containing protein [Acetobacteraceae bacterium]QKE93599.1 SHOCT domain-containing protein [Lichenicola cladoniae]